MKNKLLLRIVFTLTFCSIALITIFEQAASNSTGAPSGQTGSPNDGSNCSSCHTGAPVTTVAGFITSNIPCAGYSPSTTYTFTATVTRPGHTRFGFEISPQNASGTFLGTLINMNASTQLIASSHYITHSASGTTGTTGFHTWTFNWTAPATGLGPVTFYGAFNATNFDGSNGGDTIIKSTLVVTQCGIPSAPAAIAGNDTVCANTTGLSFISTPVSCATSYNWTVPIGASITSGQGTATMTMTDGANTGNVCVTVTSSCGTSSQTCKLVTVRAVPAAPGTITGSDSVCANATGSAYSISSLTGATGYTWTAPAGASITAGQGTTGSTLTFGTTGGNVCVTASNVCGTSAQHCKSVFVRPIVTTPVITGNDSVCPSVTTNYCCTANAGSTYNWSLTSGSILSGQGTNCISVAIPTSGTSALSVIETTSHSCVSAAGTKPITIKTAPTVPTITQHGDTLITGSATQYQWLLNGSNISSATSQNYVATASGNYSVIVTNASGCSASSTVSAIVLGRSELVNDANYSISPNPFDRSARLSYFADGDQNVTIEAFDISGRPVGVLLNQKQPAGNHSLVLNEGNLDLNPGLYFIKISSGKKVKVIRALKSE